MHSIFLHFFFFFTIYFLHSNFFSLFCNFDPIFALNFILFTYIFFNFHSYLFFSILVVGFNREAMPIFWDCQANVGVNTIRENSVEIHFFLCQPQIPCLPCKDKKRKYNFFLLWYFQIHIHLLQNWIFT